MITRIRYILNIVIVVLLFSAVAIQKDSALWGQTIDKIMTEEEETPQFDNAKILDDGTIVVNTTVLGKDIIGYAGQTPIELYIKDDKIVKIEYLENSETPSFFSRVVRSHITESWNGLTLKKAAKMKVDAVSGATYSSQAVIGNVKAAVNYAAGGVDDAKSDVSFSLDWNIIAGLVVILLGVFITLFRINNKVVIIAQMVLNVVVLGFWCGSFLSLTTFTAWAANGINIGLALLPALLLAIVVIMPLFGRKGSYCHIHCPMGSVQELAGKLPLPKIKIKPSVAKWLNRMRYYILCALLFIMWCGVGFEIMDYEVFSAFLLDSASTVVLVMAKVFLVLSLFMHRPYCKMVCPTGAVITMSEQDMSKISKN